MKTTTEKVTFESEWKRRTDLVYNAKFRMSVYDFLVNDQKILTDEQFKKAPAAIWLLLANELCGYENELNKK